MENQNIAIIVIGGIFILWLILSFAEYFYVKKELKKFGNELKIGDKFYFVERYENPFKEEVKHICEVKDIKKNYFNDIWIKYQFTDGSEGTDELKRFRDFFTKC